MGASLNFANWATRFRIKRPLSRKLRIAPEELLDGAKPSALTRFAADPDLDPLSGAIDFLLATYAGDEARARRALARLDAEATSSLLAENELRKLIVASFRRALGKGVVDGAKAALLLDFARRFDPLFAALARPPAARPSPEVLSFDYVRQLSPKLRVVLMCGARGAARPHDLGLRLASAFTTADVTCTLMPGEADARDIGPNDLVVVDENTVFRKDPARQQAHLDRVRQVSKRMCRLVPDPWGKGFHEQFDRGADRYDFHWGMSPALRQATPAIPPEKFCLIPFPTGYGRMFDEFATAPAPRPDLGFCGTIEDYNIHRYFWLLDALARGSSLKIDLTSQQPDGLDADESLRLYLGRLLSTGACLSLTMRSTGDRILVGRTFDVLRGGRLLVQEYTPDARYYLKPGVDFVEVADSGDLPETAEQVRAGAFERVRAQGAATFARAYSDQAVIRHLATWV